MEPTDSDTVDQPANQQLLATARLRGDVVEFFMTNPPKPALVHFKQNVDAKDFTKGVTLEEYAKYISIR